jgi:prepilin-type N-terminal cleavage/methylation domain-containing protein
MDSPKSKVQSPKSKRLRFTLRVSHFRSPHSVLRTGFTILELMIVIGIMGLLLTIGVPLIYKVLHRAPINQATADLFEVLSNARARAILQGKEVDLIFHPRDGRFEVEGAGDGAAAGSGQVQAGGVRGVGAGTHGKLPDSVVLRMLDINKLDHNFLEDEVARVRFFPNGTSDELTLILQSGADQRGVTLEITTGLASVLSEADLQRLRNGAL